MSIHFISPTSVAQLAKRASSMLDEANRLAVLASHLAEFEEATGRKLFISEAEQGTEFVGTPTSPEIVLRPDPVLTNPEGAGPVGAAAAPEQLGWQPHKIEIIEEEPQRPAGAWGVLSLVERRIVRHLERMPSTFTPAEDVTITELLMAGNRIEAVAQQLEVTTDQALTRWKGFLCGEVLGADGKPSIDGQQQLLNALRYRRDTAGA